MIDDRVKASAAMTKLGPRAVVLGASAGALDALSIILPVLPKEYPFPILVVVHLPPDQKSILVELLRAKCQMEVQEAEDKEPIREGTVYVAPPDYHLLVEADKRLSLSSEEAVHYSRPSIDVLFETAADAYGQVLIGVILTGASSDGALGLRAIRDAGGIVLVQCPQGAHVATMPQAALDACPEAEIMSLDQIAAYLLEIAKPL